MKPSIGLSSIHKCFAKAANHEKGAMNPLDYNNIMQSAHDIKNQAAHSAINDTMLKTLLGGLAVGGVARGGMGLLNLMGGKGQSDDLVEAPLSFQAGHKTEPAPTPLEEEPSSYSLDDLGGYKMSGWLGGTTQESPDGFAWSFSGPALAGLTGLYGGWKGMDYLIDSQRKAKLEDEEQRAKEEYSAAMQHMASKASRDQKLEMLYERTKKGNVMDWISNTLQEGGAMAAAPLPFMALGSGALTYKMLEAKRKSKLIDKALKQRERDQLADSPVFAYSPDEAQANQ